MAHIIINPSLSAAIACNFFKIRQNLQKLARFRNWQTQRERTIVHMECAYIYGLTHIQLYTVAVSTCNVLNKSHLVKP